MKIERTYKFKIDEYIKVVGNCDFDKKFLEIAYDYKNKQSKDCAIKIIVKLLNDDMDYQLLGNDTSRPNDYKVSFAQIVFESPMEFNNFVIPKWLEEFEYIE